ncbi:hypothetical protein [Rhodanobacter sp. L36]|uniref:hypothetical protein n=1 Tax=Rhodanobacter sp. L36 TaxID=1747221 RepID=UPI00131CD7B9|nr:hypothetical protein [Rhodanobacter sp. L36]
MKKYFASLALGFLFITLTAPPVAYAENKVIYVQSPKDAWRIRRTQTRALIQIIEDKSTSPTELARARQNFDARLTEADRGKLTPIETLELFRVFYIPHELQGGSFKVDVALRAIASQTTLSWYDALRFADESGRAEIGTNESFFTLALGQNAKYFIQYLQDDPDSAAVAVAAGIQDARDRIESNNIHYDTHWPASYGMLWMQCAMRNAKTCEKPKPRPVREWPTLLDRAAEQVGNFYQQAKTTE